MSLTSDIELYCEKCAKALIFSFGQFLTEDSAEWIDKHTHHNALEVKQRPRYWGKEKGSA